MTTPLFGDFNKKTKDFFDREQYDFGQQYHFKNSTKDAQFKAKVTTGAKIGAKLTVTTTPSWGVFEVNEDINKGLSLEIKVPNIYPGVSISSKHSNADVEPSLEYRPVSSFWNLKIKGYYNPNRNGHHVSEGVISAACGDDSVRLSVGAEAYLCDERQLEVSSNKPQNFNMSLSSVGFLYEPTPDFSTSLLFKPDEVFNGMDYNWSLLKNYTNFSIAANVRGKVDTKVTATPPVLSFAGGFNWGGRYLQTFFNSNKEYGIQYKFNPSDFITVQLGLACLLDVNQQRRNNTFGWKISIA